MGPQTSPPKFCPPVVRPSWMDPGYNLAVSETGVSRVVIAAGATEVIAQRNPNRYALGILVFANGGTPAVGNIQFAPEGMPADDGITIANVDGIQWFTLFQHGPFVCREWSAFSANGQTVYVWEVTLSG